MTVSRQTARNLGIAAAALAATYGLSTLYRNSGSPANAFRGKVVLITGGSRGFGLALAEEFGRAGAKLVLTARDPYELERARNLLVERGVIAEPNDALIIPCDIREEPQVQAMIERAVQHFGPIDVLVNNAGIITVGPVEDQSLASFEDAMRSNFYGMLHCTLAVLPQMLERQAGSIVNICSIGGKIPVPHLLPYSASKFAAVGFSEGLHAEMRSKGVQVTTVCPGLMRTGSHIRAFFAGNREEEYRWFSLGAAMPGVSIAAERAARQVLHATARGATELIITPQASLGARVMGLFPSLTQMALHLTNAALPKPVQTSNSTELVEGREVREKEITSVVQIANRASQQYNEGI